MPPSQQIGIKRFDDVPCLQGLTVCDDKDLAQRACVALCRASAGFEHVLVYHRMRLNQDMCDVATYITRELWDEERPVVVLCAYARNQSIGLGLSMFFNRTAQEMLRPRLIDGAGGYLHHRGAV